MRLPHGDDGLYSESSPRVKFPKNDVKGKQALVEPLVTPASTAATPSREVVTGIRGAGDEILFSNYDDFAENITEETAENLLRYAALDPSVPISFEQFQKMLREDREESIQPEEQWWAQCCQGGDSGIRTGCSFVSVQYSHIFFNLWFTRFSTCFSSSCESISKTMVEPEVSSWKILRHVLFHVYSSCIGTVTVTSSANSFSVCTSLGYCRTFALRWIDTSVIRLTATFLWTTHWQGT